MIKHIVLWKICKGGTPEDRKQVLQHFIGAIEQLKTVIPEIQEARVALNCNTGDAFHICIDSVFAGEKELERYTNHPEHLKLRDYLNSVSYDKTAFDYLY